MQHLNSNHTIGLLKFYWLLAYLLGQATVIAQVLEEDGVRPGNAQVGGATGAGSFRSTSPRPSEDAPRSTQPILVSQSGHPGQINEAVLKYERGLVLTGGEDSTARLWEIASGRLLRTFRGHHGGVHAVAIAPDGRTILTGDQEKGRLWDVSTGACLRELIGHDGAIWSASFSADGRWAVTGGNDNTARIWDVSTGREIQKLILSKERLILRVACTSVAISADGGLAFTGSSDRIVRVWDTQTWLQANEFAIPGDWLGTVTCLSPSADGKKLLIGGQYGYAMLIDLKGQKNLKLHAKSLFDTGAVGFSHRAGEVFTAIGHDIYIWNEIDGTRRQQINLKEAVLSLEGGYALTRSSLKDVSTEKTICKFESLGLPVDSARFTPDGRIVTTSSQAEAPLIWDLDRGLQRRIERLEGWQTSLSQRMDHSWPPSAGHLIT